MHKAYGSLLWLFLPLQIAAQGWGTLTGTVASADGTPLADARIQIEFTGPVVLSDNDGRFLLARVPPGNHVLAVRRLGYVAVRQPVDVGRGETVSVHVVLTLAAVPVEPVEIEAERAFLTAMRGFEERRSQGNGHFFDRQEIARMQPRVFTDVLRRVPGVQIQPASGAFGANDVIRMSRTTGVAGGRPCPVLFYVNGTPFPVTRDVSINEYIVPEDVIAVEVYSGASQIPPQFLSNQLNARCGVIVVWTRVGNEDDPPRDRLEEGLSR